MGVPLLLTMGLSGTPSLCGGSDGVGGDGGVNP